VFTVASLVCALSGSIVMLDAARAVQGLGAAAMFAVSLALLAHAYPGMRERAGALAVYGATIGASFAIGPLVGGLLTSGAGWRWIFLVNIPLGAIAIAATVARVEESRDEHARSIDWIGQFVLGGGLFLLVLALLRGNDQGWGSTAILAQLSGAVVLLALFAYVERRVKEPMLPLEFFRNRGFAATQAGTLSSTVSRNCLVEASCRDSRRCSLTSRWVATEPPFGSTKYLTRIERPSGSSLIRPLALAALT